jgi:hypothetical protein
MRMSTKTENTETVKAEDIQFQFDKVAMDKLSAIADETKERLDAIAERLAAAVMNILERQDKGRRKNEQRQRQTGVR